MRPAFKEKKVTQAAAVLLRLHNGRMKYLKLLKLLYLADREALLKWGWPITFDSYVSMDYGPVLSRTYNLISIGNLFGNPSYWEQFIGPPCDYMVSLNAEHDCPADELSEREETLLRNVFEQFGRQDQWRIVDFTHKLPEWQDPEGSSIPIEIAKILEAGGKSSSEIEAIIESLEASATVEHILSS